MNGMARLQKTIKSKKAKKRQIGTFRGLSIGFGLGPDAPVGPKGAKKAPKWSRCFKRIQIWKSRFFLKNGSLWKARSYPAPRFPQILILILLVSSLKTLKLQGGGFLEQLPAQYERCFLVFYLSTVTYFRDPAFPKRAG